MPAQLRIQASGAMLVHHIKGCQCFPCQFSVGHTSLPIMISAVFVDPTDTRLLEHLKDKFQIFVKMQVGIYLNTSQTFISNHVAPHGVWHFFYDDIAIKRTVFHKLLSVKFIPVHILFVIYPNGRINYNLRIRIFGCAINHTLQIRRIQPIVTVHKRNPFTGRLRHTSVARSRNAGVLIVIYAKSRVLFGIFIANFFCSVCRSVINQNHFVILKCLLTDCIQALRQVLICVVDRYDYRDFRHNFPLHHNIGHHFLCPCPPCTSSAQCAYTALSQQIACCTGTLPVSSVDKISVQLTNPAWRLFSNQHFS